MAGKERGATALLAILGVTILLVAVALAIGSMSFKEAIVAQAQTEGARARVYAEAGAKDALVRIARDKTYNNTGGYTIAFVTNGCTTNEGCATVTVSTGTGADGANPKRITSTGKVNTKTRKVQVDVVFDASLNGEMTTVTWTELTD